MYLDFFDYFVFVHVGETFDDGFGQNVTEV